MNAFASLLALLLLVPSAIAPPQDRPAPVPAQERPTAELTAREALAASLAKIDELANLIARRTRGDEIRQASIDIRAETARVRTLLERPPAVEPPPPTRPPPDATRPPPTDPGTRPPPTGPPPGTRPPPVDPPPTGTALSMLRANPPAGLQLIRGTIPVPATFAGPVHLVDSSSTALPTQTEIVVRGPQGEPRVIEVLALANTAGGTQQFGLESGEGPAVAAPPVQADVVSLQAADHTGRVFSAAIEGGKWYRNGAVVDTAQQAGYLRSSQDTLLGFQIWSTLVAGEDFEIVELVVHNALIEPTLKGDVYFHDLRVNVPAGYVVSHFWPELDATADGVLIGSPGYQHVLLQKQRREFRFVVHRPENRARALQFLNLSGFAVCVPGEGTWSWQSKATPWYFPHGAAMPSLAHIGADQWNTYPYELTRGSIWDALANGSAVPNTQGGNQGRAGPFHPYGVTNGGMTGGVGIWMTDGLAVLATGRVDKLHEVMALHRMTTDRHHAGIYDAQGNVFPCEQGGNYKTTTIPGTMWGSREAVYNWKGASDWRYQAVAAAGQLPPYLSYLKQWEALDLAHYVRRTSGSIVLAWLSNDPIAKLELEVAAEWARMWAYENISDSALMEADARSQQFPGKGGLGSRDSGWARTAIAANYELTSNRERWDRWFDVDLAMLQRSQLPSGAWMALEFGQGKPADAFGNPPQAVSQSFENGICISGIRACYAATGDQAYLPLLLRAAIGQSTYHWNFGMGGPQTPISVRPKDIALPAYTTVQALPVPKASDNWQTSAALCWGRMVDPNSIEIQQAIADMLGVDPAGRIRADGLFQIDNRAVLLGSYEQ